MAISVHPSDFPIRDFSSNVYYAIQPGASAHLMDDATVELRNLANRALVDGDQDANAIYQALLYSLHEDADASTLAARSYLASTVYHIEEAHIPDVEGFEPKPLDAFMREVERSLSMRDRVGNAMSRYLFEGDEPPAREAVEIYIQHHWYRSRAFWRELIEYMRRQALDCTPVLGANIYDEIGASGVTPAHPMMLKVLVEHFGLCGRMYDRPAWVEAHTYLNNRSRCCRAAHPAWGLALIYSLELTTTETHRNIHEMLVRLDVPEDARRHHRHHMLHDAEHAEDLLSLVPELITTDEAQHVFLRSLAHQRHLSQVYFGRIWEEMQARIGRTVE